MVGGDLQEVLKGGKQKGLALQHGQHIKPEKPLHHKAFRGAHLLTANHIKLH